MTQYRVVGPLEVDGKPRGELVDLDETVVNVQALIDGGHVEPVTARGKSVSPKDPV